MRVNERERERECGRQRNYTDTTQDWKEGEKNSEEGGRDNDRPRIIITRRVDFRVEERLNAGGSINLSFNFEKYKERS